MITDEVTYPLLFATVLSQTERLLDSKKVMALELENYLVSWQSMIEFAGERADFAIQDVLLLFLESCEQAFVVDEKIAMEWGALLNKWNRLVENYFKQPANPQVVSQLIHCLDASLFEAALSMDDEAMLLASFELTPIDYEVLDEANLANYDKALLSKMIELQFKESNVYLKLAIDEKIAGNQREFIENIQFYGQNWQQIALILKKEKKHAELLVCVETFIGRLTSAFELEYDLTAKQVEQLNKWQLLFSELFTVHDEFQSVKVLVDYLNQSAWDETDRVDDKQLEENFNEALAELESDSVVGEVCDLNIESSLSPAFSQATEVSIWEQMRPIFKQAVAELKVMVDCQITNDSETFNLRREAYTDDWQQICLHLESTPEGLGLSKLILVFITMSSQTFENLEGKQLILLNQWHSLIETYLITEDRFEIAVLLMDCLRDANWANPLGEKEAESLLAGFDTHQGEFASEAMRSYHPIWDKIKGYFEDAQRYHHQLNEVTSVDDLQKTTDFLQSYTDCWLSIGEVINEGETDDLLILSDSCFLFADSCQQWVDAEALLTIEQGELLKEWLFLFKMYLHEVTQKQSLLSLIGVLENKLWQSPLSADDKNMFVSFIMEDGEIGDISKEEKASPEAVLIEEPVHIEIEPMIIRADLIQMISDEFVGLVKNLSPALMDLSDALAFKSSLKAHYLKFEYLGRACQTIGLQGLTTVFERVFINISNPCEQNGLFNENERLLFSECLLLIQVYITDIKDKSNALNLVKHLQAPSWPSPLSPLHTDALVNQLLAVTLAAQSVSDNSRKTTVNDDDISLKLSKEFNQELFDSLLQELPILTANFSTVIQKIISTDPSVEHLLEAQRIAHTLKGSGNIVGMTGISVLTHHLEEILAYLTEKQQFPTKALAVSLLEAADCLEMMCEVILAGDDHAPDEARLVLQSILDWSNTLATDGLSDTVTVQTLPESEAKSKLTHDPKPVKKGEPVAMTRVPSKLVDKLLRITGESGILREQFKARVNHFSEELKALNQLTCSMQTLMSELEQAVNLQTQTRHSIKKINPEFDSLEMEQYNELHTAAGRLYEVATDIRNVNVNMDEEVSNLKYLMMDAEMIQKENQEIVQNIRMVPASTIASRCHRVVRQACRMTEKEVELTIKGDEVLIDSEILNGMIEPLMHLLRNSVDHGIESKQIRQQTNKCEQGRITLEFSRQGNYVVIHCKDDGNGLSNENILKTAIKKSLITADQALTEAEIHKLILMPGFSTRINATQVSGRGIGMDVVQTKISGLQGQMSLTSRKGEGLTIEIAIPQTLSSMLSLLVRCGGRNMAISNRGLQKIHHPNDYELIENEGEELKCQVDEEQYPVYYFGTLLGISNFNNKTTEKKPALRISDEIGKTYFVFVDELLGYRDLLVKKMGCYISHIQGITGASILGNGEVVPVVDLVEMLHHSAKYDFLLAEGKEMMEQVRELPMALVVDDSLSARCAVETLLKDLGFNVRTAIDGLDAIKEIENKVPDIMVVDLEMPRMNGIELTAHLKGSEETKAIPIIMITSRMTDKHRKQAETAGVASFMTKPFSEEELVTNVSQLMVKV
ncbi:MAG: response regulator [Methylococcales bacterium]|nr:response regulator [Methylococcales bacterium]